MDVFIVLVVCILNKDGSTVRGCLCVKVVFPLNKGGSTVRFAILFGPRLDISCGYLLLGSIFHYVSVITHKFFEWLIFDVGSCHRWFVFYVKVAALSAVYLLL